MIAHCIPGAQRSSASPAARPAAPAPPGSTGLGLSIVAAVVAEHGGELDVTSRPGDTRFVVVLPAAESGAPAGTPGGPVPALR